jgi:hypothetical protein
MGEKVPLVLVKNASQEAASADSSQTSLLQQLIPVSLVVDSAATVFEFRRRTMSMPFWRRTGFMT